MIKQLAFVFGLLAFSFGAGWTVKGLYHDSLTLNIHQAAQKAGEIARKEMQQISRESGRKLENQLEEIAHAAPKEIRTEIIKPVFTHVCVSDEFVGMYNETVANIERTLSGKSINTLPENAPQINGQDGH